jgi:2-keto-3-deoxy-6-phosphogluconate aldolase
MDAHIGVAVQALHIARTASCGLALRPTASKTDSAIASSSARSTPTVTTPTRVMTAIATSARLTRAIPFQASTSIRPRAAITMTAPRVAFGKYWMGAVRKSKTSAITTADSSPEI